MHDDTSSGEDTAWSEESEEEEVKPKMKSIDLRSDPEKAKKPRKNAEQKEEHDRGHAIKYGIKPAYVSEDWWARQNQRGLFATEAQARAFKSWLYVQCNGRFPDRVDLWLGEGLAERVDQVGEEEALSETGPLPLSKLLLMSGKVADILAKCTDTSNILAERHITPQPTDIPDLEGIDPKFGFKSFHTKTLATLRELSRIHKEDEYAKMISQTPEFTFQNTPWYHHNTVLDEYYKGTADWAEKKADFVKMIPALPQTWEELCQDYFLLWLVTYPYEVMLELYYWTRKEMEKHEEKGRELRIKDLKLVDLMGIFMFWVERRGDVVHFGPLSQPSGAPTIYPTYKVREFTPFLTLNEFHDHFDGDDGDAGAVAPANTTQTDPNTSQTPPDISQDPPRRAPSEYLTAEQQIARDNKCAEAVGRASRHFSAFMPQLLSVAAIAIIDEVSLPWYGDNAPHITKCINKVWRIAFELKTLNDALTGLRMGFRPVLSTEQTQVLRGDSFDPGGAVHHLDDFKKSGHSSIISVLQWCDMLTQKEKRPKLVIADAGFASISVAAHLEHAYGIGFIGPIKTSSAGSLKKLVYALNMEDQENFIVKTKVSLEHMEIFNPTYKYNPQHVHQRQYDRNGNGQFSARPTAPTTAAGNAMKGVRAEVAKQHGQDNVTVYQFVDGVQCIASTIPQTTTHHHISAMALRNLQKKRKAGNIPPVAGFLMYLPRWLYRIYFNRCDVFNRSLRIVGAIHNITQCFKRKYLQFMLDTTIDNARRALNYFGNRDVSVLQFRAKLLEDAKKHLVGDVETAAAVARAEKAKRVREYPLRVANLADMGVTHYRFTEPGYHTNRKRDSKRDDWLCPICQAENATAPQRVVVACKECAVDRAGQMFCVYHWAAHLSAVHHVEF